MPWPKEEEERRKVVVTVFAVVLLTAKVNASSVVDCVIDTGVECVVGLEGCGCVVAGVGVVAPAGCACGSVVILVVITGSCNIVVLVIVVVVVIITIIGVGTPVGRLGVGSVGGYSGDSKGVSSGRVGGGRGVMGDKHVFVYCLLCLAG